MIVEYPRFRTSIIMIFIVMISISIVVIPVELGEACVFYKQFSLVSIEIGHIGWGLQISGTSTYVYGSTDGQETLHIPKGQPNGYWKDQGSYESMINVFKSKDYISYNCEKVENNNVNAAYIKMAEIKANGYDVIGNNCLDHTIAILISYNAKGFPTEFLPKDWFSDLGTDGNNNGGSWSPESIGL
ncbi:unnamed protein product [Rhizophagus irregularis]|uniref:Uncharacterized protein n=2 Tax=Rhizophagus irregularis TaxID=588596 RepID=A0A915ZB71_9GLOM|nr:unnamed protein product [Rhizophagus irregularis]CAB5180192.1 unnamed protein product [Rhizophagus irregularis]CAB5369626.1 unnamed protein product [Rhizophagus irregularis]